MIEQAKAKNPFMTFSVGICDQLPFADSSFKVITVSAAYHHFPDVASFAKEAFRVLKANGNIYIAEMYYSTIFRAICNLFMPLSKAGDVKIYSPDEIVKTLKGAGFQKADYITNGHVQIVCTAKSKTETLTLNDVITLSEKGLSLSWGDFENYAHDDVGSGRYIWRFTMAEPEYTLSIEGDNPNEPPAGILLINEAGMSIDIRTDDIEDF